MAKKQNWEQQHAMEIHYHKPMKSVFGLLVLLVGLYGIAGDMGWLGASPRASPWSLLITLFGLGVFLKSTCKCPACRPKK